MANVERKQVHFVVTVGKQQKRLVTAHERGDGDLIIVPRHAQYARPVTSNRDDPSLVFSGPQTQFAHSKYSVHRTLVSPTINEIKKEIRPNPGGHHFVHRTEAIKLHDEFAPVFFRVPADLRPQHYDLSPNRRFRERIDLGRYDPTRYQLRVLACVSRPDRALNLDRKLGLRTTHANFEHFRLTLIWGYRRITSGRGYEAHPHFDERPTSSIKGLPPFLASFDEDRIVQFFDDCDQRAVRSFLAKALDDRAAVERQMSLWGRQRFRLVSRGYDL